MKEMNIKHFNNILAFADEVFSEYEESKEHGKVDSNEHPIIDVIRLLGKKLHIEYCIHLMQQSYESDLEDITMDNSLFDEFAELTASGQYFYDIAKKIEIEKVIHLNKDVILAWPWKRSRLSRALSYIGEGRIWGAWEQDNNHSTTLLLPIGITFVSGGNHSITAGIAQGAGVIKPDYIYDISPLYNLVYCDGLDFRLKSNNQVLFSVKNHELAAIFEIGRKMVEHRVSF